MALVTLCPACGTTFRVRAEQLQALGGKVRCGQCQNIFNGFSTLITIDEDEIISPAQSAKPDSVDKLPEPIHTNDLPDSKADTLAQSFSSDWAENNTEATDEEDYLTIDQKPTTKFTTKWTLASIGLLFLLIGQLIVLFRIDFIQAAPETRPYFVKLCALVSCAVPFSKQIELLSIETSDLKTDPKSLSNVITLTATIRNQAAFPMALPQLQLTLTDLYDQSIASQIFTGKDYLDEAYSNLLSISPQQEIDIKMYIDGSNLNATGYRLLLMYL